MAGPQQAEYPAQIPRRADPEKKTQMSLSTYRFARRAAAAPKAGHPEPADAINLAGGFAFPGCLPDLSREAAVVTTRHRETALQYGGTYGLAEMRDAIVDYVASDGVVCTRDEVMVTNGAKHGLDLVCRVFLDPGDHVIVSAPTYLTAVKIIESHEASFVSIEQDEEGLDAAKLEAELSERRKRGDAMPKLLFDVPDFHNPTGRTTSAARRKRLVELAETFGFLIVEDDPYRRIRFEGEGAPPIKSFDTKGVVIALGTAAKILAPGLRIGWIVASPEILRRVARQKADGGSSPLAQCLFLELVRNNQINHHVEMVTKVLKEHLDVMVGAIAEELPGAHVRRPEGGYFLWLRLPEWMDGDELVARAAGNGVLAYSGSLCFADHRPTNAVRLCFSLSDVDAIREGIRRLGVAYRSIGKTVARDAASSHMARGMASY